SAPPSRASGAAAGNRGAARAAALVLRGGGLLEIHAGDRRERREPREDVRELAFELVLVAAPQRPRQLADLLAEPHVRPGEAARAVALEVDLLDPLLELRDRRHALLRRDKLTMERSAGKGSPAA